MCPDCRGTGYIFLSLDFAAGQKPCNRCAGTGMARLTLQERTKSKKYGDVIQPVRTLARENNDLRGKLKALTKKCTRTKHEKSQQARQIVKQGKYIEELKSEILRYRKALSAFSFFRQDI